jgi:crossover junction endodeoxyribonuclease RuvC
MKIIGIDPGYERMGIAIIEKHNNQETVIYSDCIRTSATLSLPERLVIIGTALDKILTTYQPDQAAIEALYFAKNTTTAMKVAEARGVIQYVISARSIPLVEYHPNTIKIAITGYGNASKDAIASMIPRLVTYDVSKKIDDELDALAVALTHSAHTNHVYPQIH